MSSVAELLAEARSGIRRYGPVEALARTANGSVLVDLRSHDEREQDGVIPGSVHVPRSVLEWRVDEHSGFANPHVARRDLELILVCDEGYSSSLAAHRCGRLETAAAPGHSPLPLSASALRSNDARRRRCFQRWRSDLLM